MEISLGQRVEQHRKPPNEPRCLNAQVGRRLRQVQHLGAVGEERRLALLRVQAPPLHLREVSDHRGGEP